jgi:hypothetical protein
VYKREYPKFLKRFTAYVIDQCKDKPIMFWTPSHRGDVLLCALQTELYSIDWAVSCVLFIF